MSCKHFSKLLIYSVLAILVRGEVAALAQLPGQASAEHKQMEYEVGTWDGESKMWMAPGTEPMVSKGVEVNKMLGQMWLISEYESEMMGTTFVGRFQMGYDPYKKKYVGSWIDSMSPNMSTMEGTMDEANKTMTFMSNGINIMTGKEEVSKMVSTIIDHDHKKFEAFGQVPGKDGEWWKKMEITYTRRK